MKGIGRDIERLRRGAEIRTTGQRARSEKRDCAVCRKTFMISVGRYGREPETCGAARCRDAMRGRRYLTRETLGRVWT